MCLGEYFLVRSGQIITFVAKLETRCLHMCLSEGHKYGVPILSPINFC